MFYSFIRKAAYPCFVFLYDNRPIRFEISNPYNCWCFLFVAGVSLMISAETCGRFCMTDCCVYPEYVVLLILLGTQWCWVNFRWRNCCLEWNVYHMLCSERDVRCWCDDIFFCAACHLRLLQSSVDESRCCQLREVGGQRAFLYHWFFRKVQFRVCFCTPLGTRFWLGHHKWLMHDCYVYFSRNNPSSGLFSEYNQQDATFLKFIYFCKTLYIFQAVFLSIIRSTKLHISVRLLPAASSS